ncbi:hypothetical protein DQ384_39390 [Sphaerisporangium album]|uniref:Uncharacterized protein n=1 Tax=Sphaerisporangium album TaxID=509200 RepID=A0A367EL30_9ACTN|nr:hypothetical protein DQ384_39390 [Sphaerisporangium album]
MATALLTWITERFVTADVASNLLLLIETEHTLPPHRDTSATSGLGDDGDDRRPAPEWEDQMLLLAARLQINIEEILATLDGRSLSLTSERDQASAYYTTLIHLRRAIELLPQDEHDSAEPPSLRHLQLQRDRALNAELTARARQRDELAQHQQNPHLPPAPWQITRYHPNGVFEARLQDNNGRLGPRYGGWAPAPDAVPALLRAWSVPASRPIEVTWQSPKPATPTWLLPYGGSLLSHRGDDPDCRLDAHDAHDALEGLWHDYLDQHRARFATYMRQVQQAWPGQTSVADFLERRTAELNASQPPAPHLDQLLRSTYDHVHDIGPDSSNLVGLGTTVTCGWIDPAAIASAGQRTWNNFASHRPGTVPAMLTALLGSSVEEALKVWSLAEDPVRVHRIPGPAGPLYTLGENGAHRLTTARLAGLPGIWATIEQSALPMRVRPAQVHVRNKDAARLLACWRGLLARGLVTGRLEEDSHLPAVSTLHLDAAAAIWLLATPRQACAWAATYSRAYPGALATLGITPEVYTDARAWTTWLATDD